MKADVIIASALVNTLIGKISSPILKKFSLIWGVKEHLEALKKTISTVKDVLEDAANYYITDKEDINWLRKLKESVYDADDLLDKLQVEAQKLEAESQGQTIVFFKKLWAKSPVKLLNLGDKIMSLSKKLDAIAAEREKFHLKKTVIKYKEIDFNYRETWSVTDIGEIYGRNSEKEDIIRHLIHNDGREKVSIISIVGMGGLGKTTLAKLVYRNKNELKEYFDLKMWVHVSQKFYLKKILRSIIEEVNDKTCDIESLERLGKELENKLKGKKFLLVLDDVWTESHLIWAELRSSLQFGAFGSKIIVTTRSTRVSEMMKASFVINLKGLSVDNSRKLFIERAFDGSESGIDSQILEIAEHIIKKCGGVPLALSILGSTMQPKETVEEWTAIRDNDLWALGEDENQVMISLKLSYMNMPPSLKECFAYCAMFLKGVWVNKLELIDQWMAHGLVSSEEKGNESFKSLVQMSFFENVVEYSDGEVTCKIHDLVHDLARFIVGPEFAEKGEGDTTDDSSSVRYLFLKKCSEKLGPTILKKVRALHIQESDVLDADAKMLTTAKHLRSLVLQQLKFKSLPKCPKLIHLRYICFTECEFTSIPELIGSLWSLQALHIQYCNSIISLPESLSSLLYLRTLELKHCSKLKRLPESIGQSQSLQNLIVTGNNMESIPTTIGHLSNVRLLKLTGCHKIKRLPDNTFGEFNLIRILGLSYCPQLEELPSSIGNLVSLRILDLSYCQNLKSLPESLGSLHNLNVLNLDSSGVWKLPSSICKLVNLITLNLNCCRSMESLPSCLGQLKKLKHLYIQGVLLFGMPIGIGNLVNLKTLRTFVCSEESTSTLHSSMELERMASISELKNLNFLSGSLEISGLENVSGQIEAEHANLKHKPHLESLTLIWNGLACIEFDTFSLQPTQPKKDWLNVLGALQPPSNIKSLTVKYYPGSEYPEWMMQSFPYLTFLNFHDLRWCSSLPSLVVLPHLTILHLSHLYRLTIVSGYFPSLVELHLCFMPNLEKLITMNLESTEETATRKVYTPTFPRLSILEIGYCPKLRMQPHLPPSVVELRLTESNEELLAGVKFSDEEASSQDSWRSLNVRKLGICIMELSAECQLLGQLHSLRELEITSCDFQCLPDSMQHLSSLHILAINNCEGLHALPEWFGNLKSLEEISLWDTPLSCLPQSMQHLTALKSLSIVLCPELEERCQSENSEDWHLISHIPCVYVGIQYVRDDQF